MTGPPDPHSAMERGFLLILLVCATLAFAWLAGPFSGAILWGVIAAILFAPLNAALLRRAPCRPNLAAAITLLAITAVAVVPAMLLGAALLSQAAATYGSLQSGEISFARSFAAAEQHLPQALHGWLERLGLGDFIMVRDRIGRVIASSLQPLAGRALDIGQWAFAFFLSLGVMLYLTFFLLRDGARIIDRIESCLPLAPDQRRLLTARFVEVVRATIKGSLIVAVLQGMTGGLAFWMLGIGGALLWGVAMGVFSLFPAIGTAFIWVPVAAWLLFTGEVWRGGALFLVGFFIVSSVDNVVRPILVGRDARMPDYIVLIATLGGFELMGFNGFVIGPVIAALFLAVWDIFRNARPTGSG
ncbi:AI-2E family transporter [Novosphingobium sp. FKTRR1]|uniref:AI-2E family transporter n=1 Tax=Novosphingobium sp. FKTRR1 TaxID=2879118 RepID=UPI001CF05F57|nr:AI-2E family transporter [Novosphingobium sp. FKTRR1]